ncbi:type IV secretory system conjugative DNA transfer family protein [Rhizobium sp. P32RR-XVIII]|uniref:type IV secretory system conjugative DNA transfer family protein n=1 Tax=Rhizobium sp. P32RR-XVIII TaxID=2726738 RepID=UPI001456765C|nr:type IV secretory system conjugative DNA transfer family protein [Rhizobium sp. P32RR-XVIII]NLS07117.1 type IV secretory system conjugative DNA transfer family protein [Rhizobium sp. P32RR-XVIII]
MNRSYLAFYLLFCALIAVAVWMLSYSLILQIVWKDGRILRLMTTIDPAAPLRQFAAYFNNRSLQLVGLAAALPALAAGTAAAAFGLRRPASPLGDAAFQDVASLRRAGWFRKEGHIFGRAGRTLLRRNDDRHHLIIGPTRSGKGVGYVIPNALMFKGSMIVMDLKGEIFELTAGYRRASGNQVFLFSPGASKTHRWNPLDFVRTDRGSRTIDIQNMAAILIPETVGSENAVWQGTAQQVIAGVISYILESTHYKNRRNFGEVNAIFNSGVDLQALMKLIKENEPDLSRFTTDSFNAYIALNERAARSALLDIQKALAPFRNERVVAATCVTDMDLASLRRRPITIYLAPNITDMTILRPLLTLFVQQVMDLLTREHNPKAVPVYFLLDEFRQLKKMDEVLNKLPYVAGYNIKLAFIIQDLKNIDEIYGETARHSLLGNCGLQLILGANDQATADYASRALGKRTIRYQSESRTLELLGLPRRTKIEQIRERDLMMPQEVRQMPEDKMVLLVEGQRPVFGDKLRYYATEPFRSAVLDKNENAVSLPEVEMPLNLPVAATLPDYGSPALQLESGPSGSDPRELIQGAEAANTHPHASERQLEPRRQARSSVASGLSKSDERLLATARRLNSVISDSLATTPDMSVKQRKSIQDVLAKTVPDPSELGLE